MPFWETLRTAWEALLGNWLRSALSLLGVVIGVFAVATMVNLGEMALAGITRDLERLAGRGLFIQPNPGRPDAPAALSEEDLEALRVLPGVLIPYAFSSAQAETPRGRRLGLQLLATPGDLPRLDPSLPPLARGRFFTASEARSGLPLAVLSRRAAQDLFQGDPVGRTLRLALPNGTRADLVVVGVLGPPPGLFGGLDSPTVYLPLPYLWNQGLQPRGQYSALNLVLPREVDPLAVERQARRLLEGRHGADRFLIQSTQSFQDLLKGITLGLQAFLAAIAGVSLLVGGIGIMNIMLVSVAERTREIGLRKALGATSRAILFQFLLEAVILTLAGGALGLLLSLGVLALVALAVPFLPFVVNPWTLLLSLVVSLLVGLFFGVWPAYRAAQLDPIQALRSEG